MAQIARITTWSSGQVLTASALNAEFNNLITAWNNIDSASTNWTALGITGNLTVGGTATITGAMTLTGSANLNNRLNNITNSVNGNCLLSIVNANSGANAQSEVVLSNSTGTCYPRQYGITNTASLYGLTVGNYSTFESDAGSNGMFINTLAGSIYLGTVSTKAVQIDTSQNVIVPNTKLQCGGNQVYPILQVVASTTSSITNTTSNAFGDTNLSATITPKFSTSKILIQVTGVLHLTSAATGNIAYLTIANGSTNLLGVSGGASLQDPSANIMEGSAAITFYDSPATTSSVTYKARLRNSDNTNTVSFPQTSSTACMVLMEIAQ